MEAYNPADDIDGILANIGIVATLEECSAWRDRRLMALIAHRNSQLK